MMNAVTLCHHHHRAFTESPLAFAGWSEIELGAGHLEILTEKPGYPDNVEDFNLEQLNTLDAMVNSYDSWLDR